MLPAQLPAPLGAIVAGYLAPSRFEFSELALGPSKADDPEFGGWLIEWGHQFLTLTHPECQSYCQVDHAWYENNHYIDDGELDDLPMLAAKVYDSSIDEGPLAELPNTLAELLDYRFRALAVGPISIA
jgi:hypothetical protein